MSSVCHPICQSGVAEEGPWGPRTPYTDLKHCKGFSDQGSPRVGLCGVPPRNSVSGAPESRFQGTPSRFQGAPRTSHGSSKLLSGGFIGFDLRGPPRVSLRGPRKLSWSQGSPQSLKGVPLGSQDYFQCPPPANLGLELVSWVPPQSCGLRGPQR